MAKSSSSKALLKLLCKLNRLTRNLYWSNRSLYKSEKCQNHYEFTIQILQCLKRHKLRKQGNSHRLHRTRICKDNHKLYSICEVKKLKRSRKSFQKIPASIQEEHQSKLKPPYLKQYSTGKAI